MTPDLSYSTGREGESSGRIINAMKKKQVKWLYCCCYIRSNTIPKQVAPISDPIWTELCDIGPCVTTLITDQYEMIIIELAYFLGAGWFPLSTNPSRASIEYPEVGLHCARRYRGRGSNEMFAYAGWGMRIKIEQCELPHFFLVVNAL